MAQELDTPMWMVDANTFRITLANRAAERLFGYSADELGARTVFELVAPEESRRLRESFVNRASAGDAGAWTVLSPSAGRFRMHVRFHYVERDGSKLQFTFADEIYGHPDFPEGKTKGVAAE